MMEEILSLLLVDEDSDSSGDRETDEGGREVSAHFPEELLEPLPFQTTHTPYPIREPTEDELAELKKKIRGKLASRKYSRRRKEETKAHANDLRQRVEELEQLKEIRALHQAARDAPGIVDNQHVQHEFRLLFEQTREFAAQTLNLLKGADAMCSHSVLAQSSRMIPLQSIPSATMRHIPSDVKPSAQLDWAFANLRSIHDVFFQAQHDAPSTLRISAFQGWRVAESRQRGKRYCLKASKTLRGKSVKALGALVWQNADDRVKRIVVNTHHSRFSLSRGKHASDDADSDPVFFSVEQHDFPIPFLSRRVASIHGTRSLNDDFVYVKHSICDAEKQEDSIAATEIVGIVIRDAPSTTDTPSAHVDIVVAYDSHGVSHVQDLVCREPPLSHQVLAHWEHHYM